MFLTLTRPTLHSALIMLFLQKRIVIVPNNKPWAPKDLKSVMNKKKNIFSFTGDSHDKKAVAKKVKTETAQAKSKYNSIIEKQYANGDLRAAGQGSIASVNPLVDKHKQLVNVTGVDDVDLPDTCNSFLSV